MSIRTLFNIIIKIFGLIFLKKIIDSILFLIYNIIFLFSQKIPISEGKLEPDYSIIEVGIFVCFYIFLTYLLLFKANKIIGSLKLAKGFVEENISIQLSAETLFTIALVIVGLIILTNEIPNLFGNLYNYVQYKKNYGNYYNPKKVDEVVSYNIISIFKIIIALLLIGERKRIVQFIIKREEPTVEE